jgi:hypothetical protein
MRTCVRVKEGSLHRVGAPRSGRGRAVLQEALRGVGLRPAGGNHGTIKKYVRLWGISVEHFDQDAVRRESLRRSPTPLADILVEHSSFHRGHLKRRLLAEGIKELRCEQCGQGESWRGHPLALILDHINGVSDDNRLENLRIVCPNCAATFETHCGRKNRQGALGARLPPVRGDVHPRRHPAAVLLPVLRRALGSRRPSATGRPEGPRAAAARAASGRDRGVELVGGRPEVRRVGQRDPQVGAGVRAVARAVSAAGRSS